MDINSDPSIGKNIERIEKSFLIINKKIKINK